MGATIDSIPRNVYLKRKCQEIQGNAMVANQYHAQALETKLEKQRKYMVRTRKRAKTNFQRMRAECVRETYLRNKFAEEAKIRKEAESAKYVRMPIRAVQEVQHLATMEVDVSQNYLSLISEETAEHIACYVINNYDDV